MEAELTHLDQQDQELLKSLLRPGAVIEAVIPENASPQDLWRTLGACSRGINLLESRMCRLKPIIGRILLIFERKPSLYMDLGYQTYSEFMTKGVHGALGLHRTSAYEGKLVARDWPQITPDRYSSKLGPKKINILSKFMKGSNSNAEMMLKTAERMTVPELRQYTEQRGFINPGETVPQTITIHTNLAIYQRFKQVFNDNRVHSVVGYKQHDKILEAMMNECFAEWVSQYEEKEREKKNATTTRTES